MIALVSAAFPLGEAAERVAAVVVEERLAACANLTPCRSVYRWQGAVERSDEVLVEFKTLADRVPDLIARLGALHPYDLPAVTWRTVEADAAVAAWVAEAVN